MLTNSRVTSVSYDVHNHRYEGLIEFDLPDGRQKTVLAQVVGTRLWPFERVSRELQNAARFKAPQMGQLN